MGILSPYALKGTFYSLGVLILNLQPIWYISDGAEKIQPLCTGKQQIKPEKSEDSMASGYM